MGASCCSYFPEVPAATNGSWLGRASLLQAQPGRSVGRWNYILYGSKAERPEQPENPSSMLCYFLYIEEEGACVWKNAHLDKYIFTNSFSIKFPL